MSRAETILIWLTAVIAAGTLFLCAITLVHESKEGHDMSVVVTTSVNLILAIALVYVLWRNIHDAGRAKSLRAQIQTIKEEYKTQIDGLRVRYERTNQHISLSQTDAKPPAKDDAEEILFDSRKSLYASDVTGKPGQVWRKEGAPQATTKGLGTLRIEDGVLNLHRSNIDEQYELWFERYSYKGREYKKLPKDTLISGNREIHISCEAKASCDHVLRFTLRDFEQSPVDAKEVQITSNEWTPIDMTLSILPYHESQVSIFDRHVSKAPSSIQIRNLVIAQKK